MLLGIVVELVVAFDGADRVSVIGLFFLLVLDVGFDGVDCEVEQRAHCGVACGYESVFVVGLAYRSP